MRCLACCRFALAVFNRWSSEQPELQFRVIRRAASAYKGLYEKCRDAFDVDGAEGFLADTERECETGIALSKELLATFADKSVVRGELSKMQGILREAREAKAELRQKPGAAAAGGASRAAAAPAAASSARPGAGGPTVPAAKPAAARRVESEDDDLPPLVGDDSTDEEDTKFASRGSSQAAPSRDPKAASSSHRAPASSSSSSSSRDPKAASASSPARAASSASPPALPAGMTAEHVHAMSLKELKAFVTARYEPLVLSGEWCSDLLMVRGHSLPSSLPCALPPPAENWTRAASS